MKRWKFVFSSFLQYSAQITADERRKALICVYFPFDLSSLGSFPHLYTHVMTLLSNKPGMSGSRTNAQASAPTSTTQMRRKVFDIKTKRLLCFIIQIINYLLHYLFSRVIQKFMTFSTLIKLFCAKQNCHTCF